MTKKVKIGDIFKIETSLGAAYLHFVFKDEKLGELLRVFNTLYKEEPSNLIDIIKGKESYLAFFPSLPPGSAWWLA